MDLTAALAHFDDPTLDPEAAKWGRAFITHLAHERNFSEHTCRAYSIDISGYLAWAARAGLNPLAANHRQFRRYLAELNQALYSRKTIARHLSALRSFFGYLNELEVVQTNPASATASPKATRDLPRKTTQTEAERLLSVCDFANPEDPVALRDQAFLELLYASGARISEVAALTPQSNDFSNKTVRLFGKGSKERIMPLYNHALALLANYLEDARPEIWRRSSNAHGATKPMPDALFISTRGNAMSAAALRKVFKVRAAQAGLDAALHPHDMRHAFASTLIEEGADLRSVQEMLGHASLSTTQIYTQLSPEHMKEVFKTTHPRS